MVLLPHVPLSLTVMPKVPPRSEVPRDGRRSYPPWTALLEAGFPWRWLVLERIAISVDAALEEEQWPGNVREACMAWHQRAATESPLARVPTAVADELCDWLRSLAARYPGVEPCFWEAIRAARHHIAFSGDLSDIPAQLVEAWQPMERLEVGDGHHKMLGDAISVQDVQMADENNILLLRLDSDEIAGFCWGDAGILHIAVSRADLAARNFGRTHLNADCS
jgi:hypothetical protein